MSLRTSFKKVMAIIDPPVTIQTDSTKVGSETSVVGVLTSRGDSAYHAEQFRQKYKISVIDGVVARMSFNSYDGNKRHVPLQDTVVVSRSAVGSINLKTFDQSKGTKTFSPTTIKNGFGGGEHVVFGPTQPSSILTRSGHMPEAAFSNFLIMADLMNILIVRLKEKYPDVGGVYVTSTIRIPGEHQSKGPQYRSAHNDGRAIDLFLCDARGNKLRRPVKTKEGVRYLHQERIQTTFEEVCKTLGLSTYFSYFSPQVGYTHIELSSPERQRTRSGHRGRNITTASR